MKKKVHNPTRRKHTQTKKKTNLFSCNNSLLWTWNLGFLCGITLTIQIITGIALSMKYETTTAFQNINTQEKYSNLWIPRRIHSIGTTTYFIGLYLHMIRSHIHQNMKNSSGWSGIIIFILSLGIALLGYSLSNGNMAFWALTVMTSLFTNLPEGDFILSIITGNYEINNTILPRILTVHFLLGITLPIMVYWHTSEVHKNESNTDLGTRGILAGKDFINTGIQKDLLFIPIIGYFIIWGFQEESKLHKLIEDNNTNDWIQKNKTPEPIGPEWYVLPFFIGLKTTNLIGLITGIIFILLNMNKNIKRWNIITYWLCFFTLGDLALEAHESLLEPKVILFTVMMLTLSGTLLTYS
uniref:Cytochrome b n=1 Tax=Kudoa iwatai TaxID=269814 RepID=A0A0H5BIG1_9CNID|nr:cytochrome b [Kudoa iwatai]